MLESVSHDVILKLRILPGNKIGGRDGKLRDQGLSEFFSHTLCLAWTALQQQYQIGEVANILKERDFTKVIRILVFLEKIRREAHRAGLPTWQQLSGSSEVAPPSAGHLPFNLHMTLWRHWCLGPDLGLIGCKASGCLCSNDSDPRKQHLFCCRKDFYFCCLFHHSSPCLCFMQHLIVSREI